MEGLLSDSDDKRWHLRGKAKTGYSRVISKCFHKSRPWPLGLQSHRARMSACSRMSSQETMEVAESGSREDGLDSVQIIWQVTAFSKMLFTDACFFLFFLVLCQISCAVVNLKEGYLKQSAYVINNERFNVYFFDMKRIYLKAFHGSMCVSFENYTQYFE